MEFGLANREHLQLTVHNIASKLAQENVGILPINGACSDFNGKRGRQFRYAQARNSHDAIVSVDNAINLVGSCLPMVELNQRTGIQEITRQGSTVAALRGDFSSHGSRNLG